MADAETILAEVKKRKNLTGDYHDGALSGYIADAIEILRDSGVSKWVINSAASLGCITSMVTDMWDNVGGATEFSPLTQKRIIQLVCKSTAQEKLLTTMSLKENTYYYKTTKQDEHKIPFEIAGYDAKTDDLDVYINGFKLIDGIDYMEYSGYIELEKPVDKGTKIEFESVKIVVDEEGAGDE